MFTGRQKTIIVVALIWMAVTAVVFLLAVDEPDSAQKLGLAFLLFAEGASAAAAAAAESRTPSQLRRIGWHVSTLLYLILAGLAAILHMAGAGSALALIVAELVLAAVFATLLIVFGTAKGGDDKAVAARTAVPAGLFSRLQALALDAGLDPAAKEALGKVAEDVRWCDWNVSAPADDAIDRKTAELEALLSQPAAAAGAGKGAPGDPLRLIGELADLAKLRRQQGAASKRGGY